MDKDVCNSELDPELGRGCWPSGTRQNVQDLKCDRDVHIHPFQPIPGLRGLVLSQLKINESYAASKSNVGVAFLVIRLVVLL